MIHLFQFYKKHWRIPKKFYSPETRKAFQQWDENLNSQTGYIDGTKLFLPIDKKNTVHINKRSSAIILQDIIGYQSSQSKLQIRRKADTHKFPDWFLQQQLSLSENQNPELAIFNSQKRKWDFEIFSIEKSDTNKFDIFLSYQANRFLIGQPDRADHKLFRLKKNEPIKISINGKSDFSMTGRRERSYSEYEYIIEYLGEIESVEFTELSKITTRKLIPKKLGKHIDIRKTLF